MLVKGIHHVSLTATTKEQLEKTIYFYTKILNLSIYKQWDHNYMLKIGDDIVEIFLKEDQNDLDQGTIRHFAFATDCVDDCIETIRKEGYPIIVEPKDVCIQSDPVYPARVAFCLGPLNEEIEFFQER